MKLHLACGSQYKDGWTNVDGNRGVKADIYHDLSKGVPMPDNFVDYIYHEHFLEHLDAEQGKRFLRECYRVLKPGGVMRIATPDLEDIIAAYQKKNWRKRKWVDLHGYGWIKNRCEYVNICMRDWEHKFVYDEECLREYLTEIGFKDMIRCKDNESSHEALKNIETRVGQDSLILEATK